MPRKPKYLTEPVFNNWRDRHLTKHERGQVDSAEIHQDIHHSETGHSYFDLSSKLIGLLDAAALPQLTDEQLGQTAYRAYGYNRHWKTYDDKPMPQWDNLTPPIRDAWIAAASAIYDL